MDTSRRRFLFGAAAVLAAPAIVRAEIIMPVKKIILPRRLNFSSPLYKHPTSLIWQPDEQTLARFARGDKPVWNYIARAAQREAQWMDLQVRRSA